ncbi:hypothetical protein EI555_020989 [Monodon monoceros]|uniref:PI3K/PI4K catalytic domain-containing protein n=1 Tax=Monodon monoceros TaxID=40151 RepID=A0A4U1FBL2_MONMO|nr:hypothetical protein EI555_020989 [Monodon monoceros]
MLKDAQNEAYFKSWYQKLLAALQFCAGKALSDEFSKEQKLIKILGDIGYKPYECESVGRLVITPPISINTRDSITGRNLIKVACTGEGPSECNECEAFMQSRTVFQRQTLHTSEKRHVQASVGTLSVLLETLLTIREFTLGRSLTAVRNVVRPSVRVYVLFDTGSSMPGNKHIHVGSVEKPSTSHKQKPYKCGKYAVKTHTSLRIREFILVRSPMNVVVSMLTVHHRAHLGRNLINAVIWGKSLLSLSCIRVHSGEKSHECMSVGKPACIACSYFTSNALPLKITFINANPMGKNISVIFKAGDDLRQDMLVLQIIRVMDNIWLQEGLDMQMIIYRCLSTGKGQGLVQMVPDAITLAKIHRHSGLIGPLKENTIKKWFSQHNHLKVDYEKDSISTNGYYDDIRIPNVPESYPGSLLQTNGSLNMIRHLVSNVVDTKAILQENSSGEKFPDKKPKVQLVITYEDAKLTILVKHVKNIKHHKKNQVQDYHYIHQDGSI